MQLSAYVTGNSFDTHTWHEMDSTVHSQFGTVDNPVLIFTSDSSWRVVICMGAGVEDESQAHEKMYYFLREGPINRCQLCGQCFKLVRLKDEFSETNDYYSMMFSQIQSFEISEDDSYIPLVSLFGDREHPQMQTAPVTNVYIHVNNDDMDHMMVDPAYRLEKYQEADEKFATMVAAYRQVEKDTMGQQQYLPTPYDRGMYESWINVEKSIRYFDRLFLRVEKFEGRKFLDPENHERRERRMLARKRDRWVSNFTYFFGGLTEEEQMYKDYYQTDIENHPYNDNFDEAVDEMNMAFSGIFAAGKGDKKVLDFIEHGLAHEPHENFEDVIEEKLFNFRFRKYNDEPRDFVRREERRISRHLDRAETRDKKVEEDLHEVMREAGWNYSVGGLVENLIKNSDTGKMLTDDKMEALRHYALSEGVQQFRDYYESDAEEQEFFQFMDNLPERDKIRFIDCFQDETVKKAEKGYKLIPKREYNPGLSLFQNFLLDATDFKERVRPQAKDMSQLDKSMAHQRHSAAEIKKTRSEFKGLVDNFAGDSGAARTIVDEEPARLTSDEDTKQ